MRSVFFLALASALAPSSVAAGAPSSVLVVYVSRTGNTEALGRAVAEGLAGVDGIEAKLRAASEVTDEEILAASGLVLGTPVHYASASREAHALLERLGNLLVARGQLGPGSRAERRLGGVFVTGGSLSSGKDLARLDVIAGLLAMRFVVAGGEDAEGFGTLGAQATTGESDPGLSEAELEEARAFGQRFGALALELVP